MFDQPLLHVRFPADGEDDHLVADFIQALQELPRSRAWRMEIIGAFPAVELIQDAIQINTDYRSHVVISRYIGRPGRGTYPNPGRCQPPSSSNPGDNLHRRL